MRGDTISALICDAHGDVNELLRQCIERTWSHDLFDIGPGSLEHYGIVGDGFPEIVDPVGFARRHDVVVNGAHFGAGVGVFDEAEQRHEYLQGQCQVLRVRAKEGHSLQNFARSKSTPSRPRKKSNSCRALKGLGFSRAAKLFDSCHPEPSVDALAR